MLKSDLVEKIAKDLKMNHDIAQLVVNNIFDSMTEALGKGKIKKLEDLAALVFVTTKPVRGETPKPVNE